MLRPMNLEGDARKGLLGGGALKGLLVGTVLATILLGTQEGGTPLREAAWILIGATLTMLTEAYGSHLSSHHGHRVQGYVAGLGRTIFHESTLVLACLPTVLFLVLAATFHWHDDYRNADGSWTIGYTTIGGNINVVLLFILGIVAARQGGFSPWWTPLFAFVNAGLGWLVVTAELNLK